MSVELCIFPIVGFLLFIGAGNIIIDIFTVLIEVGCQVIDIFIGMINPFLEIWVKACSALVIMTCFLVKPMFDTVDYIMS